MSTSIDRPGSNPAAAAATGAEPLFDAQRLDVYRVALEFQVLSATLLPRRGQSALRDQLDRASSSIVLCIAEGAGRSSRPDKARFYGMARRSATECAAIVDIAMARRLCSVVTGAAARAAVGTCVGHDRPCAVHCRSDESRHFHEASRLRVACQKRDRRRQSGRPGQG
jgi:four helix bundle protein